MRGRAATGSVGTVFRRIDIVLLSALLAGGVAEALSAAQLSGGEQAVALVCAVLAVVALAFRRREPEASFAALFAIVALWVVLAYGWSQGPFVGFLDLLAGAFALGLYGRGRRPAIVFAAVLAALVAHDVYAWARDLIAAGDTVPAWLFLIAAYASGVAFQRRSLLAEVLADRADRAEGERELRAREAVADERSRIARELHDVIAHDVSVMVVQAQGAARVLEGDQPEVRDALAAIETTGRGAVDEMRRLLGVLRRTDEEIAFAPQPSLGELEALVAGVREAGLPVQLEVVGDPVALPPGVDLSAYRIVQEALTNALKHAGPARARVVVRYGADAVELEVSDDGAGAPGAPGTGHGLVGMRERVALYRGELQAGRRREGGWALHARLPLGAA
jgi:signal transduction histidine kinase